MVLFHKCWRTRREKNGGGLSGEVLPVVDGQRDKVCEADDSVVIQVGVWVPVRISRSGPVGVC